MTFLQQLTRSILTLCVLTSYLCVPMTGAPGWNDKMNTDVVLDLHSVFHRLTPKELKLLMSSVYDPNTLRAKLEMLQAQPGTDITDTLVAEAVGKPLDTRQVLVHILGDVEGTSSVQTSPYPENEAEVVPIDETVREEKKKDETSFVERLPFGLLDIFKKLSLEELQLIDEHVAAKDAEGLEAVLMSVNGELSSELITGARDHMSFVKGLLEVAMSLVKKEAEVVPIDAKVDSVPVDDKFIQNQLELFDRLQTALSNVPLEELQAIENGIKTRDSVQIKSILVYVQKHFPKLTDDLITSAVKVPPALMTLTSVLDTLIKKQLSVGTDPNPQSTQKSASGTASSSEMGEVDNPVEPSTPVNNEEDVASQDSDRGEETGPGLDDYPDYYPEIDDDDLPPDPEERDQDQTDNNPSNDHIDAVDTNHEEFDDGDLPDPDQKGGVQDQTDNNPSNDNTDADNATPKGAEYGKSDEPAVYDDRVKPMWNSYRQWTTRGYYDHSTGALHKYIHPEYRSTYRSTHYGRSLVFVTLVLVFLMVAGFLLFRKRKVVEQWIGPHLTKVPRRSSNILKV